MKQKDYQDDKNKLYKKYGADGYLIEPSNDEIIIRLLKNAFYPCEELESIDTFCYKNNFGRGKNNGIYIDVYGQKVNITSADELYDYLLTKIQIGGD